jgi:hypothetical protein
VENVEKHWKYCFEHFVKDTLGDELADAYIRLCDLAGRYSFEASSKEALHSYIVERGMSFTENVLVLASVVTDGKLELKGKLLFCMRQIERLAELEEVDLLKHIEHKMRYNQLREWKHGKAF